VEAYIGLTGDGYWALFQEDASGEPVLLAVGDPFEPGDAIRPAVAALTEWAAAYGYRIVTPRYGLSEVSLEDLIEPEVFDEILGPAADMDDGG